MLIFSNLYLGFCSHIVLDHILSTFDLHKIILLLNIRIVFVLENFKTLLVVLLGLCFRGCNFEDLEPVNY